MENQFSQIHISENRIIQTNPKNSNNLQQIAIEIAGLPMQSLQTSDIELQKLQETQSKIEQEIFILEQLNQQMRIYNAKYKSAISASQEHEIIQQYTKTAQQFSKIQSGLKKQLDTWNSELTGINNDEQINKSNVECVRFKAEHYSSLLKKLPQINRENHECQLAFQDTRKSKNVVLAKNLKPDLTQDEIAQIEVAPEIVTQMIMEQNFKMPSLKLQNKVSDIEERHKEIQYLVVQMEQISSMFQDIAFMINHQGEMIDHILQLCESAKDDVKKAEEHLVKGKSYMTKYNKKKCIVLICLLVIVIIIVAPTLSTQL